MRPPAAQAGRSQRQRQGAHELTGILGTCQWLPAIGWSLTRTGNLSGLINGIVPPRLAPADAYRIWRRALALGDLPALPVPGGRTRLRACASRGLVRVSLAADVPSESVTPVGETKLPGGLIRAGQLLKAACVLRDIVDEHQDLKAIAWSVVPGKGLVAVVGTPGSALKAREVFSQWERALRLHGFRERPRGRDGTIRLRAWGVRSDVPVTLRAAIRPDRRPTLAGGTAVAGPRSGPLPGMPPSPRM
jgi:hypothetical protein